MTEFPAEPTRALIVEDDRQLAAMLVELLESEGYAVDAAYDGHRGLHLGLTRAFDVIVLDRGLPAIEGLDLLGRLRGKGVTTPVLVLSAFGLVGDRVAGLDAGAEDYLAKPFDVEELLARLRALSRRHRARGATTLRVPGGSFDPVERTVTLADGPVDLSPREALLLERLAAEPRRCFGRDELVDVVFGGDVEIGAVDTYVHYLRRKLGRDVIRTVHGLGYRLGTG